MKYRGLLSVLLAGILSVSAAVTAFGDTEDEIAYAQSQKQEAEAGLAQAEANISSLESKRQELEGYLADLNAQYEELTESVSQLSVEAAENENQLKTIKKDLKKARKASKKQYEAMKLRIAYMYENSGSTLLETLLSCESVADFLNQAENISKISQYDRDMLEKYEDTQAQIREQEQQVEEEMADINSLMSERAAKQQEVQAMAQSTNDNIASYVSQISASQEEAQLLMAEIASADNSISSLIQQKEAEEAEQAAAQAEEVQNDEDYGYDASTDTTETSSSSTSTEVVTEEAEEEESYEASEEETTDTSENTSSSGQGTYLGNFVLTAYCNCAQCCGTAGNATASGAMPTAGHTVAMAGVPFGTQLLINGTVYTVEDLGTPYGHVDIYFDSHAEALSFGLQYADVYQL